MTTITRSQYLQLLGLKTLAERHMKLMAGLSDAAAAITQETDRNGEPETSGHTSDILWGNRGLEEGLRHLGITVVPDKPGASLAEPRAGELA